jgi:hypothetical protein
MAPPSHRIHPALPALAFLALVSTVEPVWSLGTVYSDTVDLAISPATAPPPIALDRRLHAIRVRYRQEDFPRLETIRFTVREGRRGSETIRHWTWFAHADSVYFQGEDAKGIELQAGYSRKNKWSLSSSTIARIDSSFQRDRFALLFPQLFAVEPGMEIRMEGKSGAPGEKPAKSGDWIAITYPAGAGIQAGETYEVLADSDGTILAWKVSGQGPRNAGMRFDWSRPKDVDELPLSLDRIGPDGFAIRFTDVKVTGSKP